MLEILLAVAVVTFMVYAGFQIAYLLELRRTSAEVRAFIRKMDTQIDPMLHDLRLASSHVRRLTENAASVTEQVREVVDTITVFERVAKKLYEEYRDEIVMHAGANVAGLKAGVKTGFITLLRTLREGKEGSA